MPIWHNYMHIQMLFEMLKNDQNDIPNTLTISRIAILLFSWTNPLTQSTLIFFPCRWIAECSAAVTPHLNSAFTQELVSFPLSAPQKLLTNISKASVPTFPTLKQTLTQTPSFCRCTKITNGTTHTCTEHATAGYNRADCVYIQQQ